MWIQRHWIAMLAALAYTLTLPTACTLGSFPEQEIETATAVAMAFAKKDFELVIEHFDPTLSEAMPAAELKKLWDANASQLGAFRGIGSLETHSEGPIVPVVVRCAFDYGVLNVLVTVTDGKVRALAAL